MIGHARHTHRAKENGVEPAKLIDSVFGHDAPGLVVIVAVPAELGELVVNPEFRTDCLQRT